VRAAKAIVDCFAGQALKTNRFTLERSKYLIRKAKLAAANAVQTTVFENECRKIRLPEEPGPIKHEAWLKEGEAPADFWTFLRKLIRHSIDVRKDDSIQLIYLGGSLFWGA
jgi:hypothetical protein